MSTLPFLTRDRCTKCGQSFDLTYGQHPEVAHIAEMGGPGIMQCRCPRCDTMWMEQPLDARDEGKPPPESDPGSDI